MASTALRLYQAGSAVAQNVPWPVARVVADAGALLAAAAAPRRRLLVERNLRRVRPGLDGAPLRRAVRATFRSYARYWAESFRLPSRSTAELDARISTEGWEHVTAAREAGNGAILAMPHLGGWEWAGFWLTTVERMPVTVVVEPLEPADVFEWFARYRTRLGMQVVPLGPGAGTAVVRALRANHIVCLLCDRDLAGDGVPVRLFGEATTLPAGPATVALRTGAPLLPTAVYDHPGGHVGVIRPPLRLPERGRLRDDVGRLTQMVAHELEVLIRRAPHQWHLMQPNWPSDREAIAAIG